MTVVPSKTKSNTRTDKSKARQKLRESRQYDPLAHVEEDTQRSRGRASGETKEVYRERVKLYEEFLTQEGLRPTEFSFQERSPAPTLEELKRFIRWYIASTKGRIDDTPTMRTVLIRAQELVPGFYLVTGNHIPSEDTEELYSWIQNDLTKDKVINDIRKGKYNFTKRDFIRVMTSFWVLDNPVFLHGRHKIQIPFITKIYLFSGARIGAFLPAAKHKKERGLRYKHIQLVLFRTRGKAPWKLGWRLDQQWVKNNRNSTYTVFSLAIWEHEKPLFSAANELLALAFLDHALFGYDTPEELFEQRIPEGDNELPLRWRDEALERCIVRNISGNTVTEDPLTKESFSPLFRQVANNAGYFVTPTIHAMRRSLGKQINKHYSSAMVAQVLTQKDDNVYGRDYVAHCSSISTVDEALEEEEDTTHIDYFQSYAQFHETGLPCKLLAIHEENVEQDPELMQLKMRISDLKGKGEDSGLLLELRSEYGVAKARLRASALQQYQTAWVQEQRDWKILTRGKLRPEHLDRTGCTRVLSKVMPELGRLAATMSANEPLQSDEKLAVIKDFYVHGNRDFDVVYRPGEYPVNGLCPDLKCKKDIRRFRKVERNSHIHDCLQKTASLTWRQNAEYCWECFQFCDQGNYNRHCQVHISSMTKSTGIHYEAITYRSTLMKPAYCIFCLWDDNDNLDAPSRMRSFSRSHDLRRHLETHVIDMKWPGVCPDGSCRKPFNDAQDFRRHLHDIHTYHKSVWQSPASTCNRVGLSKSKSTQSRGQRSPSTTKKLQTPKIIQWQPPANLEDSRISTQSPVTPQPFRHTTVLQLPPDESKAGSTHNSKLQDTGLENPHVTSPPSQHDTPKLDNSSSIPSLSNSTANTPNLLPIDPQILDGEELVETGDHSVQLYPNEGDGRWISNGGAAISVHDEADAHILDEQLSAKQRADCMDVEIYPCPNMEDLPRPSTTSNHKCPSRLPESTVESDNNHRTANLAIKNQKPFTRARAREEAAKNHNKKGRQLKTKSRRGNITEREELFLKKLARETTSEDEVFKAFLDNFPDRSKSFAQRHWVKIEPLPQRMTRSRTKRQ